MDILITSLIGIALAMDCFAVSLALGTRTKARLLPASLIIATSFGAFQGGMAIIGWIAGNGVTGIISVYGPPFAFILLATVGGKMIWEGLKGEHDDDSIPYGIRFVPIIVLSFATSIDALAVGASFGLLRLEILAPALIIGLISFVFGFCGVLLGKRLVDVFGHRTEILGGIILILIGLNILAGHPFG
ncbi:MAG TPA: manganese efflux pump [Methanoregula sp.]|nr:manganese efflux pump [Methanoregula sp.]